MATTFHAKRTPAKPDLIAVERPAIHSTAMFSPEDAAAITTVCVKTIRNAVQAGALPAYRIGTRLVICGEELIAWVKSHPTKIAA